MQEDAQSVDLDTIDEFSKRYVPADESIACALALLLLFSAPAKSESHQGKSEKCERRG
jgi:hypothetical protein